MAGRKYVGIHTDALSVLISISVYDSITYLVPFLLSRRVTVESSLGPDRCSGTFFGSFAIGFPILSGTVTLSVMVWYGSILSSLSSRLVSSVGCVGVCLAFMGCASETQRQTQLLNDVGSLEYRLKLYESVSRDAHTESFGALSELKQLVDRAGAAVTQRQKHVLRKIGITKQSSTPQASLPNKPQSTDPVQESPSPESLPESPAAVSSPEEPSAFPPPESASQVDVRSVALFRDGYAAYQRGEYERAAVGFQTAYQAAETPAQQARSLYMCGQAYYVIGEWSKAEACFLEVRRSFPESAIIPAALLKEAYALLEQGKRVQGRGLLEELVQQHPDSQETYQAGERLKELAST